MPVYDRGYTHWESSGRRSYPAWWVIARRGIVQPWKSRGMLTLLLLLLVMSWIPAIVKGVIIYVKLKAGDVVDLIGGGYTSIDPPGFLNYLDKQHFFVFVIMAIVGAGLVATDRRDNGLSLYFSRPLGLRTYVAGKTIILLFYYALVTFVPAVALCIFAYLIDPEAVGSELLLLTPLRLLVYCGLAGTSMSLVLLAFSCLGKRSIFIMVWWTVMVMGTKTLGAIAGAFDKGGLQLLDFMGQYDNAGTFLFGADPSLDVSRVLSLLVVIGWSALAIWVLRARIRPVEVVA